MSLGGATGNLAYGVNNHGEVAGVSDLAGDTIFHGFLWTKETGRMQDLAPFSPDVYSVGLAINDAGVVVGASLDAKFNSRAVGWDRGTPVDLNSRIPHNSTLYLLLACSINSGGEIIGLAVDIKTGETHGYLARPAAW
jgi:probable HAF family extracellular repeat protein